MKQAFLFFGIIITVYVIVGEVSFAQDRQLSFPDLTASPGEEITVPVWIDPATDVIGFRVVFALPNFGDDYPIEYIPRSSSVDGTLTQGWLSIENDSSTVSDPNHILTGAVLINGSGFQPLEGSGTLVTFKIKIKENATQQVIPLSFITSGPKVTRLNDGALPIQTVDGTITILDNDEPTGTPSETPTPISATPTPTLAVTPTETFSATSTHQPTITPTLTPFDTPSPGPSYTPTVVLPTFTPSPTPLPTFTPTPMSNVEVIIMDNLESSDDLSNQADHDSFINQELVIQWDFSNADFDQDTVRQVHVYVQTDSTGEYKYLGQAIRKDDGYLRWGKNSPRIARPFRDGPQFNHRYYFRVYAITPGQVYGPYHATGPVDYLPIVTITDNPQAYEDLSNHTDYDTHNDRALTIRWQFDDSDIPQSNVKEYHIYVKIDDQFLYRFLGRVDNQETYLNWQPQGINIAPQFRGGPTFGSVYEFRVYAIKHSGSPLFIGPFEALGPVEYSEGVDPTPTATPMPSFSLTPAITPTPTVVNEQVVTVTDDLESFDDLSNGQDLDLFFERMLVIRLDWELAEVEMNNIKDVHIWVQVDDNNYTFLGRTGKNGIDEFVWEPGGKDVSLLFKSGPWFGHTYHFRAYILTEDGSPPVIGPFSTAGPVYYDQGIDMVNIPTPTPTPTPQLITIRGIIQPLFGGRPIGYVDIRFGTYQTQSDENGRYEISLPRVGFYNIYVEAEGYADFEAEILVNHSQTFNIRLRPTTIFNPTPQPTVPAVTTPTPTPVERSSIYGFIFGRQTFEPVNNAQIHVDNLTTQTNTNGFFFLNNVPHGDHQLTVEADGYQILNINITLESELELILPLKPG